MSTLITVLIIVVACLVAFVVAIQSSKGGLSSSIQGLSAATQFIGTRKATDLVEKATWWFMGILVVLTFLSGVFTSTTETTPSGGKLKMNSQIESQRIDLAPSSLPNVNQLQEGEKPAGGK